MPCLIQFRSNSSISISVSVILLRCGVSKSLAELNTRSISADIAGIERRSSAYCRRGFHGFIASFHHLIALLPSILVIELLI
jgi:hypothetical protein